MGRYHPQEAFLLATEILPTYIGIHLPPISGPWSQDFNLLALHLGG